MLCLLFLYKYCMCSINRNNSDKQKKERLKTILENVEWFYSDNTLPSGSSWSSGSLEKDFDEDRDNTPPGTPDCVCSPDSLENNNPFFGTPYPSEALFPDLLEKDNAPSGTSSPDGPYSPDSLEKDNPFFGTPYTSEELFPDSLEKDSTPPGTPSSDSLEKDSAPSGKLPDSLEKCLDEEYVSFDGSIYPSSILSDDSLEKCVGDDKSISLDSLEKCFEQKDHSNSDALLSSGSLQNSADIKKDNSISLKGTVSPNSLDNYDDKKVYVNSYDTLYFDTLNEYKPNDGKIFSIALDKSVEEGDGDMVSNNDSIDKYMAGAEQGPKGCDGSTSNDSIEKDDSKVKQKNSFEYNRTNGGGYSCTTNKSYVDEREINDCKLPFSSVSTNSSETCDGEGGSSDCKFLVGPIPPGSPEKYDSEREINDCKFPLSSVSPEYPEKCDGETEHNNFIPSPLNHTGNTDTSLSKDISDEPYNGKDDFKTGFVSAEGPLMDNPLNDEKCIGGKRKNEMVHLDINLCVNSIPSDRSNEENTSSLEDSNNVVKVLNKKEPEKEITPFLYEKNERRTKMAIQNDKNVHQIVNSAYLHRNIHDIYLINEWDALIDGEHSKRCRKMYESAHMFLI